MGRDPGGMGHDPCPVTESMEDPAYRQAASGSQVGQYGYVPIPTSHPIPHRFVESSMRKLNILDEPGKNSKSLWPLLVEEYLKPILPWR